MCSWREYNSDVVLVGEVRWGEGGGRRRQGRVDPARLQRGLSFSQSLVVRGTT